jgi:hypothetical protein
MGVYSLYDCIKAGYIYVCLSIWYKGESDLSYKMVYIHAEESDWPYRLSHNAPARDRSLCNHHKDVWGPSTITQSNLPVAMHASLSRVLEEWHLFFQVLPDLPTGGNMPLKLLYEQFQEAIEDNLCMVRTHRDLAPKPGNPQWRNHAIMLWAQRLQGSGRKIV